MKDCAFSIELRPGSRDIADLARRAISGAGGHFDGDNQSGSFRLFTGMGKVEGNYSVGEQTLHVKVVDKPIFVSCTRIEKEIRKYLEKSWR